MNLFSIFKSKRAQKENTKEPMDLYKINIIQPSTDGHSPPGVSLSVYIVGHISYDLFYRNWYSIVSKIYQNRIWLMWPLTHH